MGVVIELARLLLVVELRLVENAGLALIKVLLVFGLAWHQSILRTEQVVGFLFTVDSADHFFA